jgi:hypothetical protein
MRASGPFARRGPGWVKIAVAGLRTACRGRVRGARPDHLGMPSAVQPARIPELFWGCGDLSTPPETSSDRWIITQGGDSRHFSSCTEPGHGSTHIWGWGCGQLPHYVDARRPLGSCTPPIGSIHRSRPVVFHSSPRRWTSADALHPHNPQPLLLSLFCSLLHINKKETGGVDGWGQPPGGKDRRDKPRMTRLPATLYGWSLCTSR